VKKGGKRHVCQQCNTVTTSKLEITTTIIITNILPNMEGTINGNGLPSGTQVKKVGEPLV